jgi:hypothetical protein
LMMISGSGVRQVRAFSLVGSAAFAELFLKRKRSPPPAVARRAIIEFDLLSRIMASKRIMEV